MAVDFKAYSKLIDQLAPKANLANFSRLLDDATKAMEPETKFLLKMEMKRLAKPCIRAIDLRDKVEGQCALYTYAGIQHFLDDDAHFIFAQKHTAYGDYTYGVYEAVMNSVEESQKSMRFDDPSDSISILTGSQPAPPSASEQDVIDSKTENSEQSSAVDKYQTPIRPMINYAKRSQERMNYVMEITLLVDSTSKVMAHSVDISIDGLRIKLEELSDLAKISEGQEIVVIFSGFSSKTKWQREKLLYHVASIIGKGDQTRLALQRDSEQVLPEFDEYIAQFIDGNKRRYKVNLDNTETALIDKIFEQGYAATTASLPLFVSASNIEDIQLLLACTNNHNKEILEYWVDEKDHQQIGYLVNPSRLAHLVTQSRANAELLVYCFTYVNDDKVYFYSASLDELSDNSELAELYLSYASRKASWRIFKLQASRAKPQDAYLPTSLPNGINDRIDLANAPLHKALQRRLAPITHMITVTDVTHAEGQRCYNKYALEKEKVKALAEFGHAKNKPPQAISSFQYIQRDLRRQTRYRIRTEVDIEIDDHQYQGISEDVSVSGLKLQLETPFEHVINTRIMVSFPSLQKRTKDFDLNNLRYRVRHVSSDGLVIRLEAVSNEEKSSAEAFFQHLIDLNKDKLQLVVNEEALPGMGKALRCIQAQNTPIITAYMHRTSTGYLPLGMSCNYLPTSIRNLFTHACHDGHVNLSWLFADRRSPEAFIRRSLQALKYDQSPIYADLFLAFDSSVDDLESCTNAKWEYQLSSHRERYKFVKEAQQSAQFFAFRVIITQVSSPDLSLLEQELAYMGQNAIHRAKEIEERMWNISGQCHLLDITDEMLVRYHLSDRIG